MSLRIVYFMKEDQTINGVNFIYLTHTYIYTHPSIMLKLLNTYF